MLVEVAVVAWILLLTTGVITAFILLVATVVKWPSIGFLLVAVFPIINWEMPTAPRIGDILGASVYLDDVVAVALLAAACVIMVQNRIRLGGIHLSVVLLGVLLASNLAVGAYTYDVGPAMVEARQMLFVVFASLWAFTLVWLDPAQRQVVSWRFAITLTLAMISVGAYHGAVYGLGSAESFVADASGSAEQTGRIFTASQALVTCVCAIAVIGLAPRSRRRIALLITIVAFGTLVISQQRTAILAGALGLIVLWFRSSPFQRTAYTFVVSGVAVVVLLAYASGSLAFLFDDILGSAQDTGTYDSRWDGWIALATSAWTSGPATVIFGTPFGAGFGRLQDGVWVTFSPHNWYLTVFLRGGLLGLACLVAWILFALKLAFSSSTSPWVSAVWVTLITFGWNYNWPWYVMPLAILALATPMVVLRAPAPSRGRASRLRPTSRRTQPSIDSNP